MEIIERKMSPDMIHLYNSSTVILFPFCKISSNSDTIRYAQGYE